MSLISPFPALRPTPQCTQEVLAPPYDVISTDEARVMAQGNPLNFLHISKPQIDLPEGTDPYSEIVYQKGLEHFRTLKAQGFLVQDNKPLYYLYRITQGKHTQTGLVAAASIEAYRTNRIRKHEFTRPDKELDRTKQIDTLQAQTGPVFLTYGHNHTIHQLMEHITDSQPSEAHGTLPDKSTHELWLVSDDAHQQAFTEAFEAMDCVYIADGHHRAAAAANVAASGACQHFLTVLFPHTEVQILPYHRVIKSLNKLTEAEFLQVLETRFHVKLSQKAIQPQDSTTFGLYLSNKWYQLTLKEKLITTQDPVDGIPASVLGKTLLGPILHITDQRTDPNLDFVGGSGGLEGLQNFVDSGAMAAAFSLAPTTTDQLLAVANNHGIMPPKSTWFEPKLADGLVSLVF